MRLRKTEIVLFTSIVIVVYAGVHLFLNHQFDASGLGISVGSLLAGHGVHTMTSKDGGEQ